MKYNKNKLKMYLVCLAESYANQMLHKVDENEKITPYELSIFCSTFGVYRILTKSVTDVYKLSKEDLQVSYGVINDITKLKEYWETSDLYRAIKIEMTGGYESWFKGEFKGIFTFINKVKNGEISESNIAKHFDVKAGAKEFCMMILNIIDGELIQYLLLNHANALVKMFENNLDRIDSILTFRIDSSFRLLSNVVRNETNYLNCDMNIFNRYVKLQEKAALFFYDNFRGDFFKEVVPIISEEYLNKAIEHTESSKIKYEEIGSDLKDLIKNYVADGGNPATLISFVNSIS